MNVIVDTREQRPWVFADDVTVHRQALPVGDYGLPGFSDWTAPRFIVERKSIDDLVQSLTWGRDRFWREIEKMRQFDRAFLLIEATRDMVETKQYKSNASPTAVLASIDAMSVRVGIHVEWAGRPAEASERFLSLARQFLKGIQNDARKAEKIQ